MASFVKKIIEKPVDPFGIAGGVVEGVGDIFSPDIDTGSDVDVEEVVSPQEAVIEAREMARKKIKRRKAQQTLLTGQTTGGTTGGSTLLG